MANELYIYSPIWSYTAETAVSQLNTIPEDSDLTIRLNTPGGEVMAGWSIISKLLERKGETVGVVDGQAASMGAIMLMFLDKVISNDTSNIMFHKASYPTWKEPDAEELRSLKNINDKFKEKLEAKVKGKVGGQEFLDKIFESDVRNDVNLTPQEALDLGIIDEIRTLEPKAYDFGIQVVAMVEDKKEQAPKGGENNKTTNTNKMTKDEFKAQNPTAYAELVQEGVLKERDRCEAWATFNEVNPTKVKEGIESGKDLSAKAMAEFNLEAVQAEKVTALEDDNPKKVKTEPKAKTEAELKAEADQKLLDEELGETKTY